MTALSVEGCIARLHRDVLAARRTTRPAVVYAFAQPDRIGQVTSELLMLRSLYPVDRYEVILMAPALKPEAVNQPVFDCFAAGMTVVRQPDIALIDIGMHEGGVVEHDGITYLLHDPDGLTQDFIERDRWERICEVFRLDEEELSAAREARRDLGLSLEAPVVTVHARDAGFLPALHHHSFRDADIRNYMPAILDLLHRGYVVVRLGDTQMRQAGIEHPNFLDAPFHPKYRKSFELQFIATSRFFLGTTSGPCWIARAHGIPTIYMNCQVQTQLYPGHRDLYAYKKYFANEAGRALSYREIACSVLPSLHRTNDYVARGITLVECTPAEITRVVHEMEARLAGTYAAKEEVESEIRDIDRLADLARREEVIPEPRFRFFAPALSQARVSSEMARVNPGYVVAL